MSSSKPKQRIAGPSLKARSKSLPNTFHPVTTSAAVCTTLHRSAAQHSPSVG
jgi:hypothetical protein